MRVVSNPAPSPPWSDGRESYPLLGHVSRRRIAANSYYERPITLERYSPQTRGEQGAEILPTQASASGRSMWNFGTYQAVRPPSSTRLAPVM